MSTTNFTLARQITSNRFLIARRFCQLAVLGLFLLGPWLNIWIIKGNLNSSLILDTVPLTDPFILLQSFFTGHIPEITAIQGAVLLTSGYFLLGGRVFCSWVCPVNMVTDLAYWLRRKLKPGYARTLSSQLRFWLLGAIMLSSAVSGYLAWESINPVSMAHRGIIFGFGLAWVILLLVFIFDLFISPRGWCGHLCPTGAFYSLLGYFSPLKVTANGRSECTDCGDCYQICPEPQVLKPALKGDSAIIANSTCNNCGRCIDVCPTNVFSFKLTTRPPHKSKLQQVETMETER